MYVCVVKDKTMYGGTDVCELRRTRRWTEEHDKYKMMDSGAPNTLVKLRTGTAMRYVMANNDERVGTEETYQVSFLVLRWRSIYCLRNVSVKGIDVLVIDSAYCYSV